MAELTLACQIPTNRVTGSTRTGTNAGFYAHRSAGEQPCEACRDANRAYQKSRRVRLDPEEKRLRRSASTRSAWARKLAEYGDRPVCEIPTRKFPQGRTGTKQGYFAHWYKGEPSCEPCLDANSAHRKAERDADPLAHRKVNLRSKFKITLDDYDRMLRSQAGGCAICGSRTPGHGGSPYGGFHVDHDHGCCPGERSCGKCVRGVLCGPCNTGMGNLGDDPERLIAAANYLLGARKRRSDAETSAQAGDAA